MGKEIQAHVVLGTGLAAHARSAGLRALMP